jgi:glyceraldehyde 3-phosphate dehydrogenase (phosphorylating)
VVFGVNHRDLRPGELIISNGSCTTNCLAPLAKVLNDGVGIESGIMTTIHSYTGDQPTLDRRHSDLYRARAAAMSLIPTSTGAAAAIKEVLPELEGRLDGSAIRVPTPNVSAVDLTFQAGRDVRICDINEIMAEAAAGAMRGILTYETEPKVSVDYNHDSHSCNFAADQTRVMNARLVRVMAWYDNEWGFSCRMADNAAHISRVNAWA